MQKKLGAAAIIFNGEGRVLLVKQSYGRLNWELPGGAAEDHESIIETALREVREETGLSVKAQRMTGVYYDRETDWLHFAFLCCRTDARETFRFDDEVTECAFWPTNDLPRPISDFTIRRIEDALSHEDRLLPINVAPRCWFTN